MRNLTMFSVPDFRNLLTRLSTHIILITLTVFVYIWGLFIIGPMVLGYQPDNREFVMATILAFVIANAFQPLHQAVQKVTHKAIFREYFDANKLLSKLSQVLISTTSLEERSDQILEALCTGMNISHASLFLTKEDHVLWIKTHGYKEAPEFDENEIITILKGFNPLTNRETKFIFFHMLSDSPLKEAMEKNEIQVALELRVKNDVLGIILFGGVTKNLDLSEEKVKVLTIAAPEIAVAIKNAQLYEEVRRFSLTLEEEVEKATAQTKVVNEEIYKKNVELASVTKQLAAANEKLKELDKMKDEFVSVASHELRTPMTAIKSYVWLVLHGKAGKLEPKANEYLDRVYLSCERLINLVNDMLDVSRIESGRIKLAIETVDPKKVLENVQSDFMARATEQKLAFETHIQPPLGMIQGDYNKILQVLENLVGNAFKFTPEGGKVHVELSEKEGSIIFAVTDTGRGIAAEDISKLFTKFGRLDNSLSSDVKGTGLGLYISKQYVELHKGKIWVESEVGKGSTFMFSIPVYNTVEVHDTTQPEPIAITAAA